jgi:O-antigen/teichoic acid export membrane protein
VSLACLAQSFGILGNTLLRWTYQSPLFMKINLTKAVLTTVLTITGITLLDWRANGAILVAALSACLCGMWALHAVRDHIDLTMISREKSMDLLAYSWPLLGLNIFAYFTTSLDRILLAKWSTLYNVGVFSVASTVSSLFAIATSGFFMATGPYFLSTYKESWAPKKYAEYFSVLTVLGLSSIIILGLWGAPLVGMVKPRGEYAEIGRIIPWLTASSVLYFLGAYFAPGPYIQNKTYWILIAFIISTVVNAVACYLLIPRFGILGAGLAATIGSLSAAVFIQFTGNRLYAIPNRWATAFLLTILVAILVTLVQSPLFFYRFDHGALPSKLLTTALLIIGSSIPFYRELITSDLAKTVSLYIRRMTR